MSDHRDEIEPFDDVPQEEYKGGALEEFNLFLREQEKKDPDEELRAKYDALIERLRQVDPHRADQMEDALTKNPDMWKTGLYDLRKEVEAKEGIKQQETE